MTEVKTVLCVEDDPDTCELIKIILELEGYQVVSASTSEEALEKAEKGGFSAIILDHRLAQISGADICRSIRIYDQQTPIIFFTASAFPEERAIGLAAGANEYLVKPNDLQKIPETVKRLSS